MFSMTFAFEMQKTKREEKKRKNEHFLEAKTKKAAKPHSMMLICT